MCRTFYKTCIIKSIRYLLDHSNPQLGNSLIFQDYFKAAFKLEQIWVIAFVRVLIVTNLAFLQNFLVG